MSAVVEGSRPRDAGSGGVGGVGVCIRAARAQASQRHRSRGGVPAINHGVEEFAKAGKRVFQIADDGDRGYELWTTDGTRGRANLVRDILPGLMGSEPYFLTGYGTS